MLPLQKKTISAICKENNLNTDVFLTFANLYHDVRYTPPASFPFGEIKSVIGFLKNSHIYYKEEIYPEIQNIIKKMHAVNDHKEMALVERFFNEYFNEVTVHLEYEDKVAFPYITSLHDHIAEHKPLGKPVTYAVKEYKEHHDDIEEKLNDLKNLLIRYLPPKNDQQIRRKLFFTLFELNYDLSIHTKIEDMILIPLVEQMEQHIKNQR
jgi:regulator of cell morphogenesis and NO signaling